MAAEDENARRWRRRKDPDCVGKLLTSKVLDSEDTNRRLQRQASRRGLASVGECHRGRGTKGANETHRSTRRAMGDANRIEETDVRARTTLAKQKAKATRAEGDASYTDLELTGRWRKLPNGTARVGDGKGIAIANRQMYLRQN